MVRALEGSLDSDELPSPQPSTQAARFSGSKLKFYPAGRKLQGNQQVGVFIKAARVVRSANHWT